MYLYSTELMNTKNRKIKVGLHVFVLQSNSIPWPWNLYVLLYISTRALWALINFAAIRMLDSAWSCVDLVFILKVNSTQHEYNTAIETGYAYRHITVPLLCTNSMDNNMGVGRMCLSE